MVLNRSILLNYFQVIIKQNFYIIIYEFDELDKRNSLHCFGILKYIILLGECMNKFFLFAINENFENYQNNNLIIKLSCYIVE